MTIDNRDVTIEHVLMPAATSQAFSSDLLISVAEEWLDSHLGDTASLTSPRGWSWHVISDSLIQDDDEARIYDGPVIRLSFGVVHHGTAGAA